MYVHAYIHILLSCPHRAFQSHCCNNNLEKHTHIIEKAKDVYMYT